MIWLMITRNYSNLLRLWDSFDPIRLSWIRWFERYTRWFDQPSTSLYRIPRCNGCAPGNCAHSTKFPRSGASPPKYWTGRFSGMVHLCSHTYHVPYSRWLMKKKILPSCAAILPPLLASTILLPIVPFKKKPPTQNLSNLLD